MNSELTTSGHPKIENGSRPEENHVSNTSSSKNAEYAKLIYINFFHFMPRKLSSLAIYSVGELHKIKFYELLNRFGLGTTERPAREGLAR